MGDVGGHGVGEASAAGEAMPAGRRRRRRRVAIAVVGLSVLALGACSTSRDTATSSAQVGKANGPAAANGTGAAGAGAPNADGASLNTNALDQPRADAGRSVISSATLTVKVDDVGVNKDKAAAAAEKAGGFLFAEQTTFGAQSQAVMTLKVPPAAFRPLLDELGHLGTLAAEEVKSDDVTQQVIDLQSRITATEASLGRTRDLLGGAKSLADLSQLENEVVRRQSDLESLRGQQKALQTKIDLATIVLTLNGDADATPAVVQQRQEEERRRNEAKPLPGFSDGLSGGLSVAAAVGTVCLATVGALLPFLPLVILLVVAVRLTSARRRRRAGRRPEPPVTGEPAPDLA